MNIVSNAINKIGVAGIFLLLASLLFSHPVFAVDEIEFNISSQRADRALTAFAQTVNMPVLFPNKKIRNITTNALYGRYTVEQGLDILLKDTGLLVSRGSSSQLIVKIKSTEGDKAVSKLESAKKKTIFGSIAAALASAFAASPAMAESQQGTGSSLLEEIVVTAQKRSESLQDVPISVTAFSGEALKELGINDSTQIVSQISNLSYGTPLGEGNNPAFTMRGVGLNDFQDSNEGPVGLYVDGVYLGTQAGQVLQLFDVERVEVLRGPQGTLYGRNTTGGLLHFISAKPTEDFEGYASVTFGEYSTKNFEGVLSGSLTDTVRARLSLANNRADGYIENRVGSDGNDSDNISGRLQLQFLPSDDLNILVGVHATEVNQLAQLYGHQGTGSVDAAGTIPCTVAQAEAVGTCFDFGGYRDNDGDPLKGDWNFKGPLEVDVFGAVSTVEYSMANGMEFVSITAFESVERVYAEDSDASPLDAADLVGFVKFQDFRAGYAIEAEQFSQEFRLSRESDTLNWVVGAYYYDDAKETMDGSDRQFLDVPGFFNQVVDYDLDTTSWSLFGQMDYNLTDRLVATAGLRVTEEEKDITYSTAFDGVTALDRVKRSEDFSDVSWRLGLSYDAAEEVLLYATISKGFKSGGFNGGFLFDEIQLEPFDEETLISYELGIKSTLADGKLRFNGALFYYDYTDLQFITFPAPGVPAIGNGDAEIYGADVEVIWNVAGNFEVLLGLGLLETEAQDGFGALEGNDLALSPDVSANGVFRYFHEVENFGTLAYQLDFSYAGDQFFSVDATPFNELDEPYSVWNASVSYTSPNDTFKVRLAVDNVFDKEYIAYTNDFSGDFGSVQEIPGKPRWAKVTFTYNF